jgi:hypothetical protein
MNKNRCFACIKKYIVLKNRLWKEGKITWGEDIEMSKTLQRACSWADIDVQKISDAALEEFIKAS